MKRRDVAKLLGAAPLLAVAGRALKAQGRTRAQERVEHPRLVAAISALDDAEDYMHSMSHDFGGHRLKALDACAAAKKELRLCVAFRVAHIGR